MSTGRSTLACDGVLDLGGDAVGIPQHDVIVEEQVHLDVVHLAGIAMAQGVKLEAVLFGLTAQGGIERGIELRIGGVHEAADALAHEPVAGPDDVGRHEDAADGIPAMPAGQGDESEADDGAEAGPHIGEHMLAVGFENQRAAAFAGADEVGAERGIDDDGQRGEGQALIQIGRWQMQNQRRTDS
jgi:hypothetical protein